MDDHSMFQSPPSHHTSLACHTNLRGRKTEPIQSLYESTECEKHKGGRRVKKDLKRKRGHWSIATLKLAMEELDSRQKMRQVCKKYSIPRSSLRDHYVGKTKSRKIGQAGVLTMEEEKKLVFCTEEMVRVCCPLNTTQLKAKVAELCQIRSIPFTNGVLGKSWMKWFKRRHLHLVQRVQESLDLNKAKALCPTTVDRCYENLKHLYEENNYQSNQIWNCDETRVQANKNGEGWIWARQGTRNIYTIVPNEREWVSVLVAVNSAGFTMPNYYLFKGRRPKQQYISLCENNACMGMQDNGYMDTKKFSTWMTYLITYHERRSALSPTRMMLIIPDRHKSHISMEVLLKAKQHGIDMLSLPSRTSHHLQPLDISCFKPFKQIFRVYRDLWKKKSRCKGKITKFGPMGEPCLSKGSNNQEYAGWI